ncbi:MULTISPECIES: hypothetical protein [Sphingobium]|uniref:hypothetical protein n=1 Tax=Sphingobium TaxID=165695 RepID=UPI0015EC988D|nr:MULTISPECIES: hypothetical protein [Sphingobium]MCW2362039.1 hypothetical protein [Sphingobium sp. B10D3B]MCW2394768.1 hypothetical protein [Sphingobium sp. B8D3B]MCW2401282.1 hypothetical protein [Sphingobium sp. B10D7B]MCW2408262.1 hypothetical protein [Sphingobium xanthum]MCW2418282.1 hypothetical protein [Sphingobium sp. B8D3C]
MTERETSSAPASTSISGPADAETDEKRGTKAFWAGVGIGSAALAAALMYASKRPKRRGK